MTNQPSHIGRVSLLRIRAPQKFVAGVVLVCLCAFVLWAVADLSAGSAKFMGPAMFPRSLAILLGVGGVILIADSLLRDGAWLADWSLRGPVLVSAGVLLFALTIRPFGLAVAGMLALVVSGFATSEARPREVVIFAAVMTVCCIVLFRYLLDMSIPVLIVPGTSIGF